MRAWRAARDAQRDAGRPAGETAAFLALLAIAAAHDGLTLLAIAAAALAVFYGIPAWRRR